MILAEDIVLEIISRLPVRCLIRFKCVCKTWYALIQSPDFVDMHLSRQLTKSDEHIQTLRCLDPYSPLIRQHLLTRFDDLESLSLLTPPHAEVPGYNYANSTNVEFGNHLNGIVCMFTFYQAKITLWNPAMREFRALPPRPFDCLSQFKGGYVSAMGFGFDDATNDYKVVCVERFTKDDPPFDQCYVVQVYNLKSNSWRILEGMGEFVPHDSSQCGQPIFFKGSFHWLVWVNSTPFILTFNITTELFGDIQFPHACIQDYTFGPRGLGLSLLFILDKSTLSLVSDFSNRRTSQQLDVWMLKDYNSWTKQYSIDVSNIQRLFSSWKNDQLICLTYDHALICCDLPTGQQRRIQQCYAEHGECIGALNVVVCVETLVSVGRGD